ncbi:hypothetical protein B9Z55_021824 [Caenorhabditis nigoni]|uniref:Uncharacterized protein n=1 Tax=Caenorhabditis nigoni TaxID=1611254 RepID=A0A2G5TTR6_9PELO|nr:hypothetical protein B9Z55_021824 [Caenorhabditis nigoni]
MTEYSLFSGWLALLADAFFNAPSTILDQNELQWVSMKLSVDSENANNIFNVYDNHGIWHLSSAFIAINVIDDDLMFVMRNTIRVF